MPTSDNPLYASLGVQGPPPGAPVPPVGPVENAKAFFEQHAPQAKSLVEGFMKRNDFAENLKDNFRLFTNGLGSIQEIVRAAMGGDPTENTAEAIKRLGQGVDAAKNVAEDPFSLDWNPQTRQRIAKNLDEKYNLSPEEKKTYVNKGILPDRVVEDQEKQKELNDAAIESNGGQIATIAKAIVDNPGDFALEMGKYILSNPQYMMLPQTYVTAAAKYGKMAGVAAETALGAGLGAGGAAMATSRETGKADPNVVKQSALFGAGGGFLIGVGQSFMKSMNRIGGAVQAKTGIQSAQIQAEIIRYAQKHGVSAQVASAKVLEAHGMNPKIAIDELNGVVAQLGKQLDQPFVGPPTRSEFTRNQVRNRLQVKEGLDTLTSQEPPASFIQDRAIHPNQEALTSVEPPKGFVEGRATRSADELAPMTSQEVPAGFAESRGQIHIPPKPSPRSSDPAKAMFTSPAYRPDHGAVTEPVLTIQEFQDSPLGHSASGKPLSGAALQGKYEKYHRELVKANRDPDRVVTIDEMRDIMSEASPQMKEFFMKQARRMDATMKDLPKSVREGDTVYVGGQKYKVVRRDPDGSVWIKNEAGKVRHVGEGYRNQSGEIDPRLAATLGAATVAALVGYSKEGEIEDALKYAAMVGGSIFALRVLRGYLKGRNPVVQRLFSPPKTKLDLNKLYNKWQGEGAMRERRIISLRQSLVDLSRETATGKKRSAREAKKLREQITDALESGKIDRLPYEGQQIAKIVREEFDKIGRELKDQNIIDEVVNNYVAHLWQHPTKSTEELLDQMFEGQSRGIATRSIHEKRRVIPTYALGESKGLKPRTKDITDILAMYQKAIDQARRNDELVRVLKVTHDPVTGKPLVIKGVENAPKTYRSVNHPRFSGYAVHPDLAPAVKSIFSVADFSAPVRGILALNFLLKRNAVSISAFHAKALLASAMMSGGLEKAIRHPITSTKNLFNTFRGKSPHLEMLRKGPNGDDIDLGLRNGLILNTVDDVGSDTFYNMLDDITGSLDALSNKLGTILGAPVKVAGFGVRGLKSVNKLVDGMMWDRIYTGFKVSTFLDKMSKLSAVYGDSVPKDHLAKIAAEFTNDAFGGINWLRIAENVENRYGRQLAYSLVSREGRAKNQMLLFAPDWTTANIRVFYKSFANKDPISRRLYMGYQARGMLMFMIGGDALNYELTGHHIWDNEDPTSIELGDGTRMTLSKQFMEPIKWMTKPNQEALNKMSTMLSTSLQVMTGKQWLSAPGHFAPPIENNLTFVLQKALPIWAQQGMDQGDWGRAAMSLAGFPIYGAGSGSSGIKPAGVQHPYGKPNKQSTRLSGQ